MKAALVEANSGKSLGVAQEPQQEMGMLALENGWAEQNPKEWWAMTCKAINVLMKKHGVSGKLLTIKALPIGSTG